MNREELLKNAKPILFNTEMVQAILDGRKTVTRRKIDRDITNFCDVEVDGTLLNYQNCHGDFINPVNLCRYKVGDILYVRETWTVEGVEHEGDKWIAYIGYKAEGNTQSGYQTRMEIEENEVEKYEGYLYGEAEYKPLIHMPKSAARIFLKVTDVRVERLQDITPTQCLKEGCNAKQISSYMKQLPFSNDDNFFISYRLSFKDIWDSTIKKQDLDKYGWEASPWVWVIEFERVDVENE